jgi:hypothetical protein
MGCTIAFNSVDELRRSLLRHGFNVLTEKPINDGLQITAGGSITVTYYEVSGTAVFQGKNGHVAYAALRNETNSLGDRVHSTKVLILHTEAVKKDADEFAALLRTGNMEPVPVSVKETTTQPLYRIIDGHREDLRYALLLAASTEVVADRRIFEFERELVYAFGNPHIATIFRGASRLSGKAIQNRIAMNFTYSRRAVAEVGRQVLCHMKATGCPSLQRAIEVAQREAEAAQTVGV